MEAIHNHRQLSLLLYLVALSVGVMIPFCSTIHPCRMPYKFVF